MDRKSYAGIPRSPTSACLSPHAYWHSSSKRCLLYLPSDGPHRRTPAYRIPSTGRAAPAPEAARGCHVSGAKQYVRLPVDHLCRKMKLVVRLIHDFFDDARVNLLDNAADRLLRLMRILARRRRHVRPHDIEAQLRHSLRRLAEHARLRQRLQHTQRVGIRRLKLRQRVRVDINPGQVRGALRTQELGARSRTRRRRRNTQCPSRKHGRRKSVPQKHRTSLARRWRLSHRGEVRLGRTDQAAKGLHKRTLTSTSRRISASLVAWSS